MQKADPTHKQVTPSGRAKSVALQPPNLHLSPAHPAPSKGPSWDFSRIPIRPPAARAIAAPLALGEPGEPLEADAERAAVTPSAPALAGAGGTPSARPAPAIVLQAVTSPGQPLDAATRTFFESRFRHDFSTVRLHDGVVAARAAGAIGARAYTVADHIVLGRGNPAPGLLAHELAHVVQQSSASRPWVQRAPATGPTAPRQDFVFIMGADKKGTSNPFYTLAARYFRAHLPAATFVEDKRSLSELLDFISANVTAPIGNLYIVSHGNEDGTLAFGVNSASKDGHMSVVELREALHPKAGGSSTLTSVAAAIDAQTKIHIKGCDIGRTQEMVELIDEAFGGAGTVTAPTHEQDYSTDPTLGDQARHAEHDTEMDAFKAGLPALPPEPAKVDPTLKGDERKTAKQEHDTAVAARKTAQAARATAIAAEEKRIKPDLDAVAEKAGTVDSLSGPMFQRPGTKLFKLDEIQPEVDRLYGQLPEDRRKTIAKQLVAPDRGVAGDQKGQKVIRVTPYSETFPESVTLADAQALYGKGFKDNHFVPTGMTPTRTPGTDATDVAIVFAGKAHPPGKDAFDTTMSVTETIPDEAAIIAKGKANSNNPGRYDWRVERTHDKSGKTKLTAVGERVMAYLHHGSLNPGAHDYFSEPESDPNFYATSTFAPPPPPAPPPIP